MHARSSSPITRRAALGGFLAAGGLAAAAPVPPDADARQFEVLWADLAQEDTPAARALLKLSVRPKEATLFLRARLKPLTVTARKVKALIADLGSDKREVWTAAYDELEYYDPRLAIDLVTLMADVTESPARQRLVCVLSGRTLEYLAKHLDGKAVQLRPVGDDGYNFSAEGSWWAEHKVERLNIGWGNPKLYWTRAVRAVVLLEHIGTPGAVAVLEEMATGHPDAQPTKAARESLDRLAKAK